MLPPYMRHTSCAMSHLSPPELHLLPLWTGDLPSACARATKHEASRRHPLHIVQLVPNFEVDHLGKSCHWHGHACDRDSSDCFLQCKRSVFTRMLHALMVPQGLLRATLVLCKGLHGLCCLRHVPSAIIMDTCERV